MSHSLKEWMRSSIIIVDGVERSFARLLVAAVSTNVWWFTFIEKSEAIERLMSRKHLRRLSNQRYWMSVIFSGLMAAIQGISHYPLKVIVALKSPVATSPVVTAMCGFRRPLGIVLPGAVQATVSDLQHPFDGLHRARTWTAWGKQTRLLCDHVRIFATQVDTDHRLREEQQRCWMFRFISQ